MIGENGSKYVGLFVEILSLAVDSTGHSLRSNHFQEHEAIIMY